MSVLTVSQLSNILSAKIRLDPKLRGCAVKGELSDVSFDRSGHLYFRLRDESSGIKCVMFSLSASKLKFRPFDGMSAIVYGSVDVYQRDGSCEIKATQLLPDGSGTEYLALAMLKEKLSKLGIFSAPKKALPKYPKKISVVTSENGAAVYDVKKIISKRYPIVRLEVFPTAVQGSEAVSGIVNALSEADRSGADVIILTRGGGSAEDLSAFNAEAVVMAVAGCETPIISAVGHEIDWTLSDLAADLRAPTPSGAALLATPDIEVMKGELETLYGLVRGAFASRVRALSSELKSCEYLLSAYSLESKINARKNEIRAIGDALESAKKHRLAMLSLGLESLGGLLESLDPGNVISRGYAMVYKDGEVIPEAGLLHTGDNVRIVMRGGNVGAEVKKVGDENEL